MKTFKQVRKPGRKFPARVARPVAEPWSNQSVKTKGLIWLIIKEKKLKVDLHATSFCQNLIILK